MAKQIQKAAGINLEEVMRYIDPETVMKPRKAAIANKCLDAIEAQHGQLTAENVLDAASSEAHPLHGDFEWDDSKAGHRHRLNQARALIIGARIVLQKKQAKKELNGGARIQVRRYVSRGTGEGFTGRAAALGVAEVRQQLARTKLRAIQSAVRELADMAELDAFRAEMSAAIVKAAKAASVEL